MRRPTRRDLADLPNGAASPLDVAVNRRDSDVLTMVRDAVRHKHAMLAYQPVMNATNQGSVAFYEGLIRVLDSTGRIIPAKDFMPVIEETELGRSIDVLAVSFGCRALSKVPNLRLSINMSARSIGYIAWMQELERWLKRDDTIGPRLILEITESSAMQVPELVIDFMDRLQMKGIGFALDDFGAGYTALRYFKDFFFDILKIDGQFIRGIAHDPDNLVLAQAMVSIGKQFDMLCVAEMVENQADADLLAKIGVDCLQGYHFAAPTVSPDWLPKSDRRTA